MAIHTCSEQSFSHRTQSKSREPETAIVSVVSASEPDTSLTNTSGSAPSHPQSQSLSPPAYQLSSRPPSHSPQIHQKHVGCNITAPGCGRSTPQSQPLSPRHHKFHRSGSLMILRRWLLAMIKPRRRHTANLCQTMITRTSLHRRTLSLLCNGEMYFLKVTD